MRLALSTLLCLGTAASQVLGSGFVAEKGRLYFKLETRLETADDVYDADGNLMNDPLLSGIEDGIETLKTAAYAQYGLTSRLTISASTQFVDTTFKPIEGSDQSRAGFTDLWLTGSFQMLPGRRSGLVLNGTLKIPLESNRPRFPQLTSGEYEYDLALGSGRGWMQGYVEAEVGYRWRSGMVGGIDDAGIPYEDLWFGSAKGGWSRGALLLEGLLNLSYTTADLNDEIYVPGVLSNSDEMKLQLSGTYQVSAHNAIGLSLQRTIAGKSVTRSESIAVFWALNL